LREAVVLEPLYLDRKLDLLELDDDVEALDTRGDLNAIRDAVVVHTDAATIQHAGMRNLESVSFRPSPAQESLRRRSSACSRLS
jgi:hypothetical protein